MLPEAQHDVFRVQEDLGAAYGDVPERIRPPEGVEPSCRGVGRRGDDGKDGGLPFEHCEQEGKRVVDGVHRLWEEPEAKRLLGW